MGHYEYHSINLNDDNLTGTIMDKCGQFFEIAIEHMKLDPNEAIAVFVDSGLARNFELQLFPFVSGMAGSELVEWALEHGGRTDIASSVPFDATISFSIPYWIAEMVAYFQVKGGLTYKRIFNSIPYERLHELYCAYNECTPEDFMPILQRVVEEHPWTSELKRRRKAWHMTQAELAERAQVSLRAVQQYEQGAKDLRKASADAVYRLSVVLRCTMEDLIC